MNNFQKVFVVNEITKTLYDNPELLIEHSNDAIKSAALMALLEVKNREKVDDILTKIRTCIKELIMNIYTYSDEVKFFIGINVRDSVLQVSFRFEAHEFDVDNIIGLIASKEELISRGKTPMNGLGFVLIKRNSDKMSISKVNDSYWNRQVELEFKLN